ncbi:MAG TPA: protein kinase [Micropepsaceae bacterium]|nr:protein kinase [Micropepsaceae bacterium]
MWIKTVDLGETLNAALSGAGASGLAASRAETPAEHFARGLARTQSGDMRGADADFMVAASDATLAPAASLERGFIRLREMGGESEALKSASGVIDSGAKGVLRARALHLAGFAEYNRLNAPAALDRLTHAARAYEEAKSREGAAQVHDTLGSLQAMMGAVENALVSYMRSYAEKTVIGDRMGVAITLGNIGRLCLQMGRLEDAEAFLARDHELAIELSDARGQVRTLSDIARTRAAQGRHDEAAKDLAEATAMARKAGLHAQEFLCLKDAALVALARKDRAAAKRFLDEAEALIPKDGAEYERLVLNGARAEYLIDENPEEAARLLEEVVAGYRMFDMPDFEIGSRLALARAYVKSGKDTRAGTTIMLAMKLCRGRGFARYFTELNEAMERLSLTEGVLEESGVTVGDTAAGTPEGYVLRECLGAGAFGQVFRAFDLSRGREVALKRLSIDQVYDRASRDALLDQMRLEFEAAARARHPGLVRIYAMGRDASGSPYVAQEFIPGSTLRAAIGEEKIKGEAAIARTLSFICHALAALHEAGVVHRDLKPENVMLREDGAPVLVDFGISHVPGLKLKEGASLPIGTRGYMAPEQQAGGKPDPRGDLYAVGVMAFEMVNGERPTPEILSNLPQKSGWRLFGAKSQGWETKMSGPLADLVRQLLAQDENARLQSAAEAAHRFEAIAAAAETARR